VFRHGVETIPSGVSSRGTRGHFLPFGSTIASVSVEHETTVHLLIGRMAMASDWARTNGES
jgi:hypothetical protein